MATCCNSVFEFVCSCFIWSLLEAVSCPPAVAMGLCSAGAGRWMFELFVVSSPFQVQRSLRGLALKMVIKIRPRPSQSLQQIDWQPPDYRTSDSFIFFVTLPSVIRTRLLWTRCKVQATPKLHISSYYTINHVTYESVTVSCFACRNAPLRRAL